MEKQDKDLLISYLNEIAPTAEAVFMIPGEAVFEECVKSTEETGDARQIFRI